MRLYDLTLPTPAANLALDEALLLSPSEDDALRFWEPDGHAVVLGRSSRYRVEANLAACQQASVPILRRVSGGASIVAGPGCLMYAVVVNAADRPELLDLDKAHQYVLSRMVEALRPLDSSVQIAGTSDLAIATDDGLRKFSGNSLRRVRDRLLYHGTLLYDFDLSLVGRLLDVAPRQPAYRQARDHYEFVTNLGVQQSQLKEAITAAWNADRTELDAKTRVATEQLAAEKYALASWSESR